MAARTKLLLIAPLALLMSLSPAPLADAATHSPRVACAQPAKRCPICGGDFEDFKRKYFFVVRQSVRLVAWIAS